MAGEKNEPDRIERMEQTLQGFQRTLQQITETLTSLATQVHGPQVPPVVQIDDRIFARGNQPPNQRFQPRNRARDRLRQQEQGRLSDDSDIEEESGEEEARVGRFG